MKHIYTLLIITLISLSTIQANQVPLEDAKDLATAAFQLYAGQDSNKKTINIQDHYTKRYKKAVSYYAFNFSNGGYIILSADDQYNAVLAFSDTGYIDFADEQANIGIWGELTRHELSIAYGREKNLKSNTKIASEWQTLKNITNGTSIKKNLTFDPVVGPLTTTKWNQSGFYSESCPADTAGVDGNTYCGCLPIAAAQLMRYYENPAPGNGSVSYNDPLYGPQSVDLCGQTFDWANMPDTLSDHNSTLADFIYNVGKSTETHYSTSYTGTYVSKLRDALVYYYGFDSSMKSYYGTDASRYSSVLKEEFDEGRVVFLSGWTIDSLYYADIGHTWVADGYGYSNVGAEYMHFNWGWGGSNNGWFLDTPGFWVPHETNPEQANVSYYWYRYTLYNIFPAGEDCQSPDPLVTEIDPAENYAWMYYRSPVDEEVRFRFREAGTLDWTTTASTLETHTFAGSLKKGTNYEYQLSRNCCGDWSSFSDSQEFVTEGGSPDGPDPEPSSCTAEEGENLSTSGITESFAYIYTSRPHGSVSNQFRFRSDGQSDWVYGDINSTHYYTLTNLMEGTNYEFQVRHLCSEDNWSEYSESMTFKTAGESANTGDDGDGSDGGDDTGGESTSCAAEEADQLTTSSVSESFAYIYTSRPHGTVSNQFRFRVVGQGDWVVGDVNSLHYYALMNLKKGTSYEFQVRHLCSENDWSGYSGSMTFKTAGESDTTGDDSNSGNGTDEEQSVNCAAEEAANLTTSSISTSFAYIYTSRPHGSVSNQFRFKAVEQSDWVYGDVNMLHYYTLSNLEGGTTYEFQVRHLCSEDNWSEYSASMTFMTDGSNFISSTNFIGSDATSIDRSIIPEPIPFSELRIKLYPNPVVDDLQIDFDVTDLLQDQDKGHIDIVDQTGRVINHIAIGSTSTITYSVSDLASGIYFVRLVDTKGEVQIERFVKM